MCLIHLAPTPIQYWSSSIWEPSAKPMTWLVLGCVLLCLLWVLYIMNRPRPVYLVNFSCSKPDPALVVPHYRFHARASFLGFMDSDSLAFVKKILERSGLGPSTCLPEALHQVPLNICMPMARMEAESMIFYAVDELFEKTRVMAQEIGILVVNCSLFCPTPSLPSLIINRYGLNENVHSYNLTGMGCSAGIISVDVVNKLFQVHPNTIAMVVSTEILTMNSYFGNNRPMLVTNCLFRMGGAAVLLSNRPSDRCRSKYQLFHTLRTHRGQDDKAYSCAFLEEDRTGKVGVSLNKDLMVVAGEALKANLTILGPLVLPFHEQLRFLSAMIARNLLKFNIKAYVPDFKLAFEHFCIHAGGRAVLDEMEKNLGLEPWLMEPSRMALYRFGNTSSSSLWYELAYCEAKGRVKKGDRVWQIAFGSGFKCNSAVWKALKTVNEKNVWSDEIERFPVHTHKVAGVPSRT